LIIDVEFQSCLPNRFQKSKGGIWAGFQNALEVTVGVQLGVVSDKYFNPVHAAEA